MVQRAHSISNVLKKRLQHPKRDHHHLNVQGRRWPPRSPPALHRFWGYVDVSSGGGVAFSVPLSRRLWNRASVSCGRSALRMVPPYLARSMAARTGSSRPSKRTTRAEPPLLSSVPIVVT